MEGRILGFGFLGSPAVFILPSDLFVVGAVDMHLFVAMATAIIIKTVKPYVIIEEETGIKIIITTVPYITIKEETSTEIVPYITIEDDADDYVNNNTYDIICYFY